MCASNLNKTFGVRLKENRERIGLSKADIAYELGLSIATIEIYEREEALPDKNTLIKVEKFFKEYGIS